MSNPPAIVSVSDNHLRRKPPVKLPSPSKTYTPAKPASADSWTGQDSREAAYQHLDAVKAFIDFVDNDIVENVNKKRLDIKNNQVHHDFVYGENELYKAWGTFYKQCYADGIGYLDVANVEQKTTDWHNKFIGIQEKNNALVGEENTATPKTDKEQPPPGAKLPGVGIGALGDLAAPLGIAAVVLVGVALATRR